MQQPKIHKQSKKIYLPLEGLRYAEISTKVLFYCQPLNEVWEGVDPGSTSSIHSGILHAPELPCISPAFPPGAPVMVQAVT